MNFQRGSGHEHQSLPYMAKTRGETYCSVPKAENWTYTPTDRTHKVVFLIVDGSKYMGFFEDKCK